MWDGVVLGKLGYHNYRFEYYHNYHIIIRLDTIVTMVTMVIMPSYHSHYISGTVSVGFAVTCPLSAWAMSRFTNRHILMAGSLVLGTGSIVMRQVKNMK